MKVNIVFGLNVVRCVLYLNKWIIFLHQQSGYIRVHLPLSPHDVSHWPHILPLLLSAAPALSYRTRPQGCVIVLFLCFKHICPSAPPYLAVGKLHIITAKLFMHHCVSYWRWNQVLWTLSLYYCESNYTLFEYEEHLHFYMIINILFTSVLLTLTQTSNKKNWKNWLNLRLFEKGLR